MAKTLSTKEAAEMIGCEQWHIWQAYRHGAVPAPTLVSPRKARWSLLHIQRLAEKAQK